MAPDAEGKSVVGRTRLLIKRVMAAFSLFSLVIYLGLFIKDSFEFWHQAKTQEIKASLTEYQQKMQEEVTRQSDEIKKVDAIRLGRVYSNSLDETDCNWRFVCHERVYSPDDYVYYRGIRTHKIEPLFTAMMIPTVRTWRGTPHAIKLMAIAVAGARGWAISMFLACTVIWLALLFLVLSSESGSKTMMPWMMLMGSPIFIPLLVWCVQWVAVLAMEHLGWAVALAAHVAAYSSALAVLVGVRHVLKTPHEMRELTAVLRKPA